MPSSSRIVFAEDLGAVAPWTPGPLSGMPSVYGKRVSAEPDPEPPPAPSYEDGLRDGWMRARESLQAEFDTRQEALQRETALRLDALVAQTLGSLHAVQTSMAAEILDLGVEIARGVLGSAIRTRDDAVEPAVQAALDAIVDGHARPQMRLHPDDLAWVGEQLSELLEARGVQLVPDPAIHPGGCLVETNRGVVDATVQTRWRRILAELSREDEWVMP